MNQILDEVAKQQQQKTPFCERYIEFLKADLPKKILESVIFNIVEWQWKKGELRTDRMYKVYEGRMGERAFAVNEENIMANKSDDKILKEMVAFKEENSLDMCVTVAQWFDYIVNGGQRQ